MLQIKHAQYREIVTDIFTQTTVEYNFSQNRDFRIPSVNIVYDSSENTSYIRPKFWEIVPVKISEINSIDSFKK